MTWLNLEEVSRMYLTWSFISKTEIVNKCVVDKRGEGRRKRSGLSHPSRFCSVDSASACPYGRQRIVSLTSMFLFLPFPFPPTLSQINEQISLGED